MEKCNIFPPSPFRPAALPVFLSRILLTPEQTLKSSVWGCLLYSQLPLGLMTQFALSTTAESAFLPAQVWEGKTTECQVHPRKMWALPKQHRLGRVQEHLCEGFKKKLHLDGKNEKDEGRHTHNVGAVSRAAMRASVLPVRGCFFSFFLSPYRVKVACSLLKHINFIRDCVLIATFITF